MEYENSAFIQRVLERAPRAQEVRPVATVRVGINGFGRIGRNVFRAALDERALEFVAVNDITDARTLAHLLKYDSVHGTLRRDVQADKEGLVVDGKPVRVLAERDPAKLPWKQLGVDLVLECSGLFTERGKAAKHLDAGAKKVVISAPAKGADLTVCMGVNDHAYDPAKHAILSNASCTTNCLAPRCCMSPSASGAAS
jgi:glyceraldehyde 3-phosphate dehydrogenase (phosphorylating)